MRFVRRPPKRSPASLAPLVRRDRLDPQARRRSLELQAGTGLLAPQVLPARKDHAVQLDLPALLAYKARAAVLVRAV